MPARRSSLELPERRLRPGRHEILPCSTNPSDLRHDHLGRGLVYDRPALHVHYLVRMDCAGLLYGWWMRKTSLA